MSTTDTQPSPPPDSMPRRVLPFGPVRGVEWVSLHCIDRFRERVEMKGTFGQVLRRLEEWVQSAFMAELKPGKVMPKMFRHDCRAAIYYHVGNVRKNRGWILVVEGNTLKTIHKNESGEWQLPATKH